MNKTYLFFCAILALKIFTGCASPCTSNQEKVIISGQIRNNTSKDFKILVPSLATGQQREYRVQVNEDGTFTSSFIPEFQPQGVYIMYRKVMFPLLVHGGDSIFMQFEASNVKRSIRFSGSAGEKNELLIAFDTLPVVKKEPYQVESEKIKNLSPESYLKYCDSLYLESVKARDKFFKQNNLTPSMRKWMFNEIEYAYVYNKFMYPDYHRDYNKIQGYWKWDVNDEYYDFLNNIEISEPDLINPLVLSDVISAINIGCVNRKVLKESGIKTEDGHWAIPDEYDRDSLWLTGINKYVKNDLLRQLCLCASLANIVKYGELKSFEKHQYIVDEYITNTHLKEQLINFYSETKMRVENPEFNMQAVLMEISNTPAISVLDSILQLNKGKVIYVDCWATWCGPCRSEIPYSKELMGKLKDSPVSFIFLCFDSEKKEWLKSIQESYLGGTHYFLSNESAEYFKKVFEVEAYPTYLLFDTKGNIRSYNTHRPSQQAEVLVEIQKLIDEGAS